ncbi:hypothetical protein FQA47_006093 [Oryzias melastigma]|uniref:Uncharacterized protein n=1 Tax=Oryzias melastigma TaxID=30732 RepID=A0A834BVU6_ORYME|nr:hypothetical protein FQA47_006093 [Oryzias melastigma]
MQTPRSRASALVMETGPTIHHHHCSKGPTPRGDGGGAPASLPTSLMHPSSHFSFSCNNMQTLQQPPWRPNLHGTQMSSWNISGGEIHSGSQRGTIPTDGIYEHISELLGHGNRFSFISMITASQECESCVAALLHLHRKRSDRSRSGSEGRTFFPFLPH